MSTPKKKSLLWSSFDKKMVDSKNVSPPVSAAELEMRREGNPLKWWKDLASSLPKL